MRRTRNRRRSFARTRHTLGQSRHWLTYWDDTPEARSWGLARLLAVSIERALKHIFGDALLTNLTSDSEIMAAFAEATPAGTDISGGRYIESAHYYSVGDPVDPVPSRSGRTVHRVLR